MNLRLKLALAGLMLLAGGSALPQAGGAPAMPEKKTPEEAAAAPPKESLADQIRAILEKEKSAKPSTVRKAEKNKPPPIPVITVDVSRRGVQEPTSARASERMAPAHRPAQRAAAHVTPHGTTHGPAHWSYAGEAGPQAWDRLNPDFKLCAAGKRQSPIHIDSAATLLGPAEPLQFGYKPSGGSVVNNGHTLQVDVEGENTLTVRGSAYRLLQFHFHHPAEERVNQRSFAMVAHLVHRNAEGQLAVVAVLMDPGEASPLIDKVWTYLPLEVSDRVRVPADAIDLNKLLPQDQRYYQFMGSLTTPPCSEGVLWMVLKTPVTLSAGQLKLFAQLFPNNARPVQALNGRVVREAQ